MTWGRSGNDSRCCHPEDAPYEWVEFFDPNHSHVVSYESWLAGLEEDQREFVLGEIDGLFELAEEGKLLDSGDNRSPIKPVTHVPEIYELRYRAGAAAPFIYLRFYHSEPENYPRHLVALHRQIKDSEDAQTDGLAQAIAQHEIGERELGF